MGPKRKTSMGLLVFNPLWSTIIVYEYVFLDGSTNVKNLRFFRKGISYVAFFLGLRMFSISCFGTFIVVVLCRGSCFLSYAAENSHHLGAKIISKEALC